MKPETFTITTFWLDWSLVPIMLAGAWFTARWAKADGKRAAVVKTGWESSLPGWSFSVPLHVAAAGWLIAGFGALIKEDYWEMRVIFVAMLLWTVCCFFGAVLLFLGFLRMGRGLGSAGMLNLLGLVLMFALMILPGLVDHESSSGVTAIGHLWFALLAASAGLLTAGLLLGFPYKFPRFPLGLGGFFLIGWGLSEITFHQASFPWMVRIWKQSLGMEYLDAFPVSSGWQIAGAIKLIAGLGFIITLIIVNWRRKALPRNHPNR